MYNLLYALPTDMISTQEQEEAYINSILLILYLLLNRTTHCSKLIIGIHSDIQYVVGSSHEIYRSHLITLELDTHN
jgi:hypothetical protein